MASAEITHKTIGRVNVSRDPDGRLRLRLFMWSLDPEAVLTVDEWRRLVARGNALLKPTSASDDEDPYGVG